jgi:hypothetical protein
VATLKQKEVGYLKSNGEFTPGDDSNK